MKSADGLALVAILSGLTGLSSLVGLSNAAQVNQTLESDAHKEKAFSIFHVVNFKNVACRSLLSFTTGTSSARNGTCYTQSECPQKGGTVSGNCASGFGVCCVFVFTSTGAVISQNNSYIQNPGFPAGFTGTTGVSYTINKYSADVCWIRLDFETFAINGPSASTELNGGACDTDTFKITTNTNQVVPIICGSNAGQHIYIDIGAVANDNTVLNFAFTGAAVTTRSWDIRESQIECSNPNRPPNGCLQYYSTLVGRITTFNFIPATGSNHLASQEYSACIRRQSGYCCIQYQVCPETLLTGFTLDFDMKTAMQDTNCPNDYVGIPGSTAVCSANSNSLSNKYCGSYLNQSNAIAMNVPICDCTLPFVVHFHTDTTATANEKAAGAINRGVCLDYTQLPCTTN